jgi:SAM-dependent methyltransferase
VTLDAATPPAATAMPSTMGTREAFERFLRWTVDEEYAALPPHLPGGEREAFVRYYQRLPKAGDGPAMRRFLRGQWRGDAGWVSRWLAARRAPRVLDAGSGFGTFSMLYASVGAEVVGVDLRPDRLDAAERRLAFHRERTGIDLAVRYQRGDLTREWPGTFDLVWVYNALSHIDPLDPFIAGARDHLRPGGVLVVGDINGAHPEHLARLATLREEVHQTYVAPDGERHAYAVERPFPPGELRRIMERNGLRVRRHELYWRGMAQVPDVVHRVAMAPLQRAWWLGARFGRRQMIVAGREPEAAS